MNPTRKDDATSPAPPVLSVVIPTYCERDNIGLLIERLNNHLKEASLAYEVIVVDDASPDGTADTARSLGDRYPVRVIRRHEERGLATAVLRGIEECRGYLVVVMDGDLSHPPERVADIAGPVLEGRADMTIGSRYIAGGEARNWPWLRRVISKTAIRLASPLTPVKDPMSGFFCIRRDLLQGLDLNPLGYKIALEILVKASPQRVLEIPICFADRRLGKSKFGPAEMFLYLRHLQRLYPVRFSWLRKAAALVKALIILLILLELVFYSIKNIDDMNGPEAGQPKSIEDYNDFNAFFGAGEGILKGKDIYFTPTSPEGRHFIYPPAFALYMSAVAGLGLRGAAVYWYLVSLLMVIASAFLLAGIFARDRAGRSALVLIGILIVSRFICSDLNNGNANAHVLLFLCLGLWLLVKRRGFAGGFSFGIAAMTKVTPIIFLGYFAWKLLLTWSASKRPALETAGSGPTVLPARFWTSTLCGMIAALVLLSAVVPTMVLGVKKNYSLHRDFAESMIFPYARASGYPEKYWDSGFSLKVFLLHYLTSSSSTDSKKRPPRIGLADWPRETVWRLYLMISLIIIGISLFSWRGDPIHRVAPDRRAFILSLEVGTVAAVMLLISPLTRKAHMIVLLIPVIASLGVAWRANAPGFRRMRNILISGALVVGVIGLGATRGILGRELFDILVDGRHTILFWAPMLIWISCTTALFLLGREEKPGLYAGGKSA